MNADPIIDDFRSYLAQCAMQACWHAVYPSEDDEPTAASIRFIDHVISVARDGSLPLGRRIERLENLLTHYLRTQGSRFQAPVLKLV
jgi:hypothetical protein